MILYTFEEEAGSSEAGSSEAGSSAVVIYKIEINNKYKYSFIIYYKDAFLFRMSQHVLS